MRESRCGAWAQLLGDIVLSLFPQEMKLESAQNFSRPISRHLSRKVCSCKRPNVTGFSFCRRFLWRFESSEPTCFSAMFAMGPVHNLADPAEWQRTCLLNWGAFWGGAFLEQSATHRVHQILTPRFTKYNLLGLAQVRCVLIVLQLFWSLLLRILCKNCPKCQRIKSREPTCQKIRPSPKD